MSKRLLGVDVDITVCPSDRGWVSWLEEGYLWKDGLRQGELLPYDLSSLFEMRGDCGLDYWRELDYSQFQPLKGSVESLEKLSNYFGIVFISREKGTHGKSKYYWLKHHFPFMTEYVSCHKKHILQNSLVAMIDDRMDVLGGFEYNKRILFQSPYEQSVNIPVAMSFKAWDNDIVEQICKQYI